MNKATEEQTLRYTIANNLVELRKSRQIRSQAKFVDYLNGHGMDISLSTIKQWESGNNAPTLDKLVKIAELFGCSIDFICKRHEDYANEIEHISEITSISADNVKRLLLHHSEPYEITAINCLLSYSWELVDYIESMRIIKHGYEHDIEPIFKKYPDIRRAYKTARRRTLKDAESGLTVFYNLIKDKHFVIKDLDEKQTARWIFEIAYNYESYTNQRFDIVELMDSVVGEYSEKMDNYEHEHIKETDIDDVLQPERE